MRYERLGGLYLLAGICLAQSPSELQALVAPRSLELSSDGRRLAYKLGQDWWEVAIGPKPRPKRVNKQAAAESKANRRISPDGQNVAFLDKERPYGPSLLFLAGRPQPVSRMPVFDFQWAPDSNSLWVIAAKGADEPVGKMHLDGRFEPLTQGAAMRRSAGLASANGVLAWVQSDGSHYGTIWIHDQVGNPRVLVDPNPQMAKWNLGTQEVVRWKNKHGEELEGILARPSGGARLPLIVDPYSSWRNRSLNIPVLGNYAFVREGFAVFFPDHRAPHTFPAMSFGEAYVGAAKDRDPVDVLTDDVMTGVDALVRRGIADADRLFLYSSSNGASAIDQLLTQTRAFRAAVSHGGVSDWLGYYESRRSLGDETIPGFLRGRKPEDSPGLYRRISPLYQAAQITTPLLLLVGEKDTRLNDTRSFYEALIRAGSPATLVIYPGQGHEISTAALAEEHVRKAIEFFRTNQK